MKRSIKIALITAISAAFLITSIAVGIAVAHWNGNRMTSWLSEELNLNSSQVQQLESVHNSVMDQRANMRDTMEEIHELMVTEVKKDSFNAQDLTKQISSKLDTLKQSIAPVAASFSNLHSSLTPNQKQQLSELIEDRRFHRFHRFHRGFWNERDWNGKRPGRYNRRDEW